MAEENQKEQALNSLKNLMIKTTTLGKKGKQGYYKGGSVKTYAKGGGVRTANNSE